MSYIKDLQKKERMLVKKLKEAEERLKNTPVSAPNFLEVYDATNLLRIDIKTVRSRIENYGRPGPYMDEYYLPEKKY